MMLGVHKKKFNYLSTINFFLHNSNRSTDGKIGLSRIMKNERRKIKIFHVSQENNPFYSSHLHLNVVNDANECKVFFY
jgi:hypothetical protein